MIVYLENLTDSVTNQYHGEGACGQTPFRGPAALLDALDSVTWTVPFMEAHARQRLHHSVSPTAPELSFHCRLISLHCVHAGALALIHSCPLYLQACECAPGWGRWKEGALSTLPYILFPRARSHAHLSLSTDSHLGQLTSPLWDWHTHMMRTKLAWDRGHLPGTKGLLSATWKPSGFCSSVPFIAGQAMATVCQIWGLLPHPCFHMSTVCGYPFWAV